MRWIAYVSLTIALLASLGCDAKGSANGGGMGNGAHGHAQIGVPF